MKEVMIFYILYISISFTLFESTTYVSKAHFVCLVACFLLLFEKDVFEKAKNLVIYTDIHFRYFGFLIHLQHFLPFFLSFYLAFKLKN